MNNSGCNFSSILEAGNVIVPSLVSLLAEAGQSEPVHTLAVLEEHLVPLGNNGLLLVLVGVRVKALFVGGSFLLLGQVLFLEERPVSPCCLEVAALVNLPNDFRLVILLVELPLDVLVGCQLPTLDVQVERY